MRRIVSFIILLFISHTVLAAEAFVTMNVAGKNKTVGIMQVTETDFGLLFTPDLRGVKPGHHEFNVYDSGSCNPKALAASDHFDPEHTNQHLGPYNKNSHLGDLPDLYAAADGTMVFPVLAPRILNLDQIRHHAIVIRILNSDKQICGVIG